MNHFWNLTQEVGLHLHIPPAALTHWSIPTALTHRRIPTARGRKKKNEEKEKVKIVFLLKSQTWARKDGKMGIERVDFVDVI